MAGSLSHIVASDGTFTTDLLDHMGDANEALDECFQIIFELTGGDREKVNEVCRRLRFPEIDTDMKK